MSHDQKRELKYNQVVLSKCSKVINHNYSRNNFYYHEVKRR